MARNGRLVAPTDGWVDVTDGVVSGLMLDVLDETSVACPGVYVRFQTGDPGAGELVGHQVPRGQREAFVGVQMELFGGRAWARSISAAYPAILYVTATP